MKTIRYRRNPEILYADMNGETVMMEFSTAKYYNLGEIGGRIWEILEVPKTLGELATELMKEYDVDRERCESDLLPFLADLKVRKLIETSME